MTAGSGRGEEIGGIVVEATAHAEQLYGRRRQNCSEAGEVYHDQPVTRGQLLCTRGDGFRELGHSG